MVTPALSLTGEGNPEPEHVMVNVVLTVILVITCDPLVATAPVHCPFGGVADAVQDAAFVEAQLNVELPPEAMDDGEVLISTNGPGLPAELTFKVLLQVRVKLLPVPVKVIV
jgi:hypothetical protein